ncbi:MAG: hypothetical protein IT320_14490 [Anaerolineae bacterium]|nr:hypothetical protein [Anaerolineae bacterium]
MKWSRLFTLLLILPLFFLFHVAQSQQPLTESYTTEDGGLSFQYPAGWDVTEESQTIEVTDGSFTISFVAPALAANLIGFLDDDDPADVFGVLMALMDIDTADDSAQVGDRQVIGQFNVEGGQFHLALLLELPSGDKTLAIASGPASDFLTNPETILAILQSAGALVEANGDGAPGTTAAPSTQVCTVSTNFANSVRLRVGPGTNRAAIAYLAPGIDYDVLGSATAFDNSRWYRLEVSQVSPDLVNTVNEIWVAARDVTESDGCATVEQVPTPRIIPIAQRSPTPRANATSEPEPTVPAGVFIFFSADDTSLSSGECTTLRWDTSNIREVYYQGSGVVGTGEILECPRSTTTYELRIVLQDGSVQLRHVTVGVDEREPAAVVASDTPTPTATVLSNLTLIPTNALPTYPTPLPVSP